MDDEWNSYRVLGEQAATAGNLESSEAMWAMAVLIAQDFNEKDSRLAYSLDNISHALMAQEKYSLAERFLNRAWRIKTKVLGSSQLELARTLNMVSEVFYHQHKFNEAEMVCRRVFEIYNQAYGRQHQHTIVAADNLALLERLNQTRQAESPAQPPRQPPRPVRRFDVSRERCEVCGAVLAGDWCMRCTGTSLKAISPTDRLT